MSYESKLREQIIKTLHAYEDAYDISNGPDLITHIYNSNMEKGLCYYTSKLKYTYLCNLLLIRFPFDYLCDTPSEYPDYCYGIIRQTLATRIKYLELLII